MSDEQLPDELEMRLRRLENPAEQGGDFDRFSWFWMVTLGLVFPGALVLAWCLA